MAMDVRFGKPSGKLDDLALGLRGHTGLLIAPAGYVKSIGERAVYLAHGLGGPAA